MQGTPLPKNIQSVQYRRLLQGFTDWLGTLGYARATVYGLPKQLKEFLIWLEHHKIMGVEKITQVQINNFIHYFKNRSNRRRPGGIGTGHVNKQIDTIQKFIKYLSATGQAKLNITLKLLVENERPTRAILTKTEIQEIYSATDDSLLGMRDRAMLAVYYGCGLRKSEGLSLEVPDVLFERRLLYVRKAKNGHERYVPIGLKCLQDLEQYIYSSRPLLLGATIKTEALFISVRGTAVKEGAIVSRLKTLQQKTGNPLLQNKNIGLHALRHSIATHLLQAGMELENIALFLGHRTLDSTQVYTHIINGQ